MKGQRTMATATRQRNECGTQAMLNIEAVFTKGNIYSPDFVRKQQVAFLHSLLQGKRKRVKE